MTPAPDARAAEFEAHRDLLMGIAYRMLGSTSDAEDIVQDAWPRWREARDVESPRGWLVRVVTRLCLDRLKSARVRREHYFGTWLPEPLVQPHTGHAAGSQVDESVSIALLLVLEKLSPAERAGFLLHEVFGYAFAEIAAILGKAEPACREGEIAPLLGLFADGVAFYSDGGGKASAVPRVLTDPAVIAKFFIRVLRSHEASGRMVEAVRFNGAPGVLIVEQGVVVGALSLDVRDGGIAAIYGHRNPDKLREFARG